MKDRIYIDGSKPQWKGNMHMHSVRSDGKLQPAEVVAEYKKRGFDFIQLSDHDIYWDNDEFDTEDFLVLAGTEASLKMNEEHPWELEYRRGRGFRHMHLGCLKDVTRTDDYVPYAHDERVPRVVDRGIDSWNKAIEILKDHGNLVWVNHPHWSRIAPEMLLAMNGCMAIEVWNTGVMHACGGRDDTAVWDYLLQRGKRVFGLAGDDAHGIWPTLGVSFNMVQAEKLTKPALVEALKKGEFYASTGPIFKDIRVEDGVLKMQFSPTKKVVVTAESESCGRTLCAQDGEYLETYELPLKPYVKYYRPMIIDDKGQTAWAQPIFLDELEENPMLFSNDSADKEIWLHPEADN